MITPARARIARPDDLPVWIGRRLDEGFLNPFRAEPLGSEPKQIFRDPFDPPLPRFVVPIHPLGDSEQQVLVEAVLAADPTLPPVPKISVRVERGVVTLTGRAATPYLRRAAEVDAWLVPGIRGVRNCLSVQPGPGAPAGTSP